ncbi:biliverdin reductase A [Oryzias melastigma]|uniref:biliverdin reductase A n=1 Tax=Oryzias melastigma TaxID=30732 RepID=UPI00168CB68F|nr:biliverdin reductase A [Oryzias melastigma]
MAHERRGQETGGTEPPYVRSGLPPAADSGTAPPQTEGHVGTPVPGGVHAPSTSVAPCAPEVTARVPSGLVFGFWNGLCSDCSRMFGAVVVGIGTAGWVRIRDMLTPHPGSPAEKLAVRGFISRRNLDNQQGVSQISVEEAVSRDDIHAAFICTENESHEDYVRTFLQAGKHVSVEYPMTMSHKAAVELWDLAQKKGVVLHEEHIELLTEDFKELKRAVEGKVLQEGTLHFTGGALKPGFGFPAFSGIARLTWLVELFGKLSVSAATLEEDSAKGYSKMTAKLLTSDNRPLTWVEERQTGLPRAKNINFVFDSCTLSEIPAAPRGAVGLFMQDLIHFSAKISDQVSPSQLQGEKERVLHCLELADRIQQLCQSL